MYHSYPDNVHIIVGFTEARIALLGAHVYSWKVAGEEQLFLSTKSGPINGPAAIRGGIPICWPVFGPPPDKAPFSKLKQHGFARTTIWSLDKVDEGKESIAAHFRLDSSPQTERVFAPAFKLIYTVTISLTPDAMLSTSLKVLNPSPTSSLSFQALLHTYFALPPTSTPVDVKIKSLKGLKFTDKVTGGTVGTEDRKEVGFEAGEVDRVYSGVPEDFEIEFGSGLGMSINTVALNNLTIWNPAQLKSDAMPDMQPEGWRRFVCVEPGQTTFVELGPGKEWLGSQTLIPKPMEKL